MATRRRLVQASSSVRTCCYTCMHVYACTAMCVCMHACMCACVRGRCDRNHLALPARISSSTAVIPLSTWLHLSALYYHRLTTFLPLSCRLNVMRCQRRVGNHIEDYISKGGRWLHVDMVRKGEASFVFRCFPCFFLVIFLFELQGGREDTCMINPCAF